MADIEKQTDGFDGTLWKILKWSVRVLGSVVVAVWCAYCAEFVYQSLHGQIDLEYTIQADKLADFLPQNAATVVKITSGKLDVSNGTVVTVSFWNRSVTNLDRTEVRVTTAEDERVPFHKLLIYPSASLDKDWVNWLKPADNADLDFSVDVLNSNWSAEPNISVRYFYPGDAPQQFVFKTKRPGVAFVPYDESKITRWFFGLDVPLLVSAFGLAYFALCYGVYKFNKWFRALRIRAFSRTMWNGIVGNFPQLDLPTKERMLWLAVWLFAQSTNRKSYGPAADPNVAIPPEIGR
ncbi:MAG: hypothetical protein ABR964_05630 [Tepidisphaeraceae bacterium]|jgi:hypothetical protein